MVLAEGNGDRIELRGHWARPNPQATHAGHALAIVHGPHAYVSPAWYPDKEAEEVVQPVESPLAGGLDGLPGHALLAVVLVGDRPDDLAREPAAGLLELELLLVELEIHRRAPPGTG